MEMLSLMNVVVGEAMGLLVKAALIWFIANYMIDLGAKSPFKKCIGCALALALVNIFSVLCLLIPIPLLNYAIAIIVWYKGSVAAIEGSLEATKGGFTILLICLVISIVAMFARMSAMA